jgi:hypothetical protein
MNYLYTDLKSIIYNDGVRNLGYRYSDNYLVPFRGIELSDKLCSERSKITALAVGCFEIIFLKIYR